MEINIKCSPGLQAEITEKSINSPQGAAINSVDVYVYRACGTDDSRLPQTEDPGLTNNQ
jgi:hypothetical protein